MAEQILEFLEHANAVINLFAVAVIVVGFALSAGRYALQFQKVALDENFKQFKIDLGRALTLALEILVLADVIESITVGPTFKSLAFLGFLVVARTVMSWTLALEIEGHWPWQSSGEDTEEEEHV